MVKPKIKTCVVCNNTIGKSGYQIQCQECRGWAHLTCTTIVKEDLLKKKNCKWTCPKCKEDGDSSSEEEISSDEEEKEKASLSTKTMFKTLLKKVEDLEAALTFNGGLIEDMRMSLEDIKKENKGLRKQNEKLSNDLSLLQKEVSTLKQKAAVEELAKDIERKKKNIVIVGVENQDEILKVMNSLKVNVTVENINVKQIPTNKLPTLHVVTLPNEETKKLILKNRKEGGLLNSKDLGLNGIERNIFINEDLPRPTRELFKKARELKPAGYKYVWVKEGKVFCRKSESVKPILLIDSDHVDKLKKN